VDPRLDDPTALPALSLDEALVNETGERLADGGPAHAGLGGEILFGRQVVTGDEPLVRNRQRDLLANLVMQRYRACRRRRHKEKVMISRHSGIGRIAQALERTRVLAAIP